MSDLPKKSIRITDLTRLDTSEKIDAKQELLFAVACNQTEKDTFSMPVNSFTTWLLLKHAANRDLSNLSDIGQAVLDAKQDYFNKVADNSDLNTFTQDGIWKVTLTGAVECHAPSSGVGYYVVSVDTDEDGLIEQQARNLNASSGDIYHRQRINGTWTGWGLITQDMANPTFTEAPTVINPGTRDDQLATIGQLNGKFSDIFQTEWRITEGLFVEGDLSYAGGVFTMKNGSKYYTNDSIKVVTTANVTTNIPTNVTKYVFANAAGQLKTWNNFVKAIEFPSTMLSDTLYYNIYTDQYADANGYYSLAPLGMVENGAWIQNDGIQFLNVANLKEALESLTVQDKVDREIGDETQNSIVSSDTQYERQISAGHYLQNGEEYELDFGAGVIAQSHEEDEDTEGQYNKSPEATVFAQDGAVRTEINVTPQGAILSTPRLDEPSEIATMADLDDIIQTSLTFVGYVSASQPSSSTFTFKVGNIWINSATMPTTFPVPASSIRVWNGTSWETTTKTYTASDFDFVRNVNDNEGYYWFGGVWKIMSTDMDTDYFELGSDGKWKIKTNVNLPGSPTTTTQTGSDNSSKIATTAFVQNVAQGKSSVSVSSTGTSTNAVKYITVNGVEYQLAGSGGSEEDNLSITKNASDKIQTIGVINQNDTTRAVKKWVGSRAGYDAIVSKDPDTEYTITDDSDLSIPILQTLYPVGASFITFNATCPLANLFGTWQKVGTKLLVDVAGSNSVPVKGNGKTMVLWDGGSQYGALRQGGDAVNPNTSTGATSLVMPASNGNSTQFSNSTLIGLTNNAANSGIIADISGSLTKTELTINIFRRTA